MTNPVQENPQRRKIKPFDGGQTRFLQSSAYEVLYAGDTGSGKSAILVMDALGLQFKHTPLKCHAIDNPSYRGILFRRKTTHLVKLIDEANKVYPQMGGEFVFGRRGDPGPSYNFPSGARIFFCHMEEEKNKYDHDGQEYQFAGFDELQQFSITGYLYLHSRMRSTVPGFFTRIRASAMAVGTGIAWVKKRFDVENEQMYCRVRYFVSSADPEYDPKGLEVKAGTKDSKSRAFVPGYLEENLAVNKEEYRANVTQLGSRFVQAMLHHDWSAFSGDFFKEFDPSTEIIDPIDIPREWTLINPIDPGWGGICASGLLAQDFERNIYLISTYYERARNPEQNAKGIKSHWQTCKWTNGKMPDLFPCGLDAWAKKDRYSILASNATFADVLENEGMMLTRAITDRANGWGTLRGTMPGRFFVFKGSNQPFLDEIVSAPTDEKDVNDIRGRGNDPAVADHALDMCRYGVMSLAGPLPAYGGDNRPPWMEEFEQDEQGKAIVEGWKVGMD